jgi:hypothetical protein
MAEARWLPEIHEGLYVEGGRRQTGRRHKPRVCSHDRNPKTLAEGQIDAIVDGMVDRTGYSQALTSPSAFLLIAGTVQPAAG